LGAVYKYNYTVALRKKIRRNYKCMGTLAVADYESEAEKNDNDTQPYGLASFLMLNVEWIKYLRMISFD